MSKYDIILDKLEKNPSVPMIIGGETISYSELKIYFAKTEEEAIKDLNENTDMTLNKKNMIMILSDSYRKRAQNNIIKDENSYQKKLLPSKPNGFIDISLFFFMILTSALSILNVMLFIIKANL